MARDDDEEEEDDDEDHDDDHFSVEATNDEQRLDDIQFKDNLIRILARKRTLSKDAKNEEMSTQHSSLGTKQIQI